MDKEIIEQRINEFFDQSELEETDEQETIEVAPELPDMLQEQRVARRNLPQPRVRGAKPRVALDLDTILEGPIKEAYKKTVDDTELLKAEGETERARLLEQQYMQDYYYPAIDALIRLNSMEEVLASQETLEALDALALVPGGGATDGYASMFVSSLYEPVGNRFSSDAQVRRAVQEIRRLSAQGQVRQAGALARRTQENIDSGRNIALPEDYELIQRVVLRTS